MQTLDPNDGGITSRKFWLTILTTCLIMAGGGLAAYTPAFAGSYPALIGGLLAALAAYSGANVSAKWVTGKHLETMADKSDKSVAGDKVEAAEDPAEGEKC